MIAFSKAAHRFGRKPVFVVAFVAAMVATIFFYQNFNTRDDIWMSFVLGVCQLSLFAGFAIYLPELFPTRLRSTGTSFCYNVGRFIAASGPVTLGVLQANLGAKAIAALPADRHRRHESHRRTRRLPHRRLLHERDVPARTRRVAVPAGDQGTAAAGRLSCGKW